MPFASQHRPGLWPTWRRDDQSSGYQPLSGAITSPVVAWRSRLGGPIFDAHVVDGPSGRTFLLLFGGCVHSYLPDGTLRWKSIPFGAEGLIGIDDIDRDGRVEIVASNGKSVVVLSEEDGSVIWEEYFGPPFGGGFMFTCVLLHHFAQVGPGMQLAIGMLSTKEVVLLDFSNGAANPVRRHILWMDDFFHPTVLAADVNGDGLDELIVTKYSAVYVFDPLSGELLTECRWSSGGTPKRNYGLFQLRDISGNGSIDILILSYVVSRHLAVVENDGLGEFSNKWDRFIEHVYPHDERELRYTGNSCTDIDRDGRLEIVVSVYNERLADRWSLEVVDAWTGNVRSTHDDLYFHDLLLSDDNSSPPIVLASYESERTPDEFSTMLLLEYSGDGFRELWRGEEVGLFGKFQRPAANSTIFKTDLPPRDLAWWTSVDGVASLALRLKDDAIGLLALKDGVWQVGEIDGTAGTAALLAVDDIDQDGTTELLLSDWHGTVRAVRSDGSSLFSLEVGMRFRVGTSLYYLAKPMQTPVVVDANGDRFCVVPDAGTGIHILEWDPENLRPNEVVCFAGRGKLGPEEGRHSVAVIEWEGAPVILASEIGSESAVLRAVDLHGVEQHRWDVPSLPGTPRVATGRTGIHEYLMVPGDGGPYMMISGFRSGSMNSECTVAMNAVTGELLWERVVVNEESEDGRGFGPWNGVTYLPESNPPELFFLAKDSFCHLELISGELRQRPWHLRPYNTADLRRRGMSMDDFSAYGTPAPVQLNNAGEVGIALLANYGGMGVINLDHSVRWWRSAPLSSLTAAHAGLADIDGDGITEIGLSYIDGEFVVLRADTGEEKWRLHLGQVAADVVACDIDGDGRVEFILATREGELIALGSSTSGCGLVKWRMKFDYGLGPPIVADFDGDGRSEILVVSGDGYLYGITG